MTTDHDLSHSIHIDHPKPRLGVPVHWWLGTAMVAPSLTDHLNRYV